MQDSVNELTKIVKDLKIKMNTGPIINNINNMNITINLNSFSREKIEYLNYEFIKECLKEKDIVRLLKKVHFDPNHPENHTVRIKNINKNLLEYYQDGEWIIDTKDRVLKDMINISGYRILKTFYRNNRISIENELTEEEDSEEINNWLNKIDREDKKLFNEIKKDLFLVILNNKAMICSR